MGKACLKNGDEVAGWSKYADEAALSEDLSRGLNRMDNLSQGYVARNLDVTQLTVSVVQERLTLFEIKHLPNLDPTSFVSKAWKQADGLSPAHKLMTLQTELMPAPVRFAMSKSDGPELYSVLMGKPISSKESDAIFELFHVRVKPTDQNMPSYHFITENKLEPNPIAKDQTKSFIEGGVSDQLYIRNVENTTPINEFKKRAKTSSSKKRDTYIVVENPPEVHNENLLLKDIKLLYKISKFQKIYGETDKKWKLVLYCPTNIDSLKSNYGFSEQQAKRFLTQCQTWKKNNLIDVLTNESEIRPYLESHKDNNIVYVKPIPQKLRAMGNSVFHIQLASSPSQAHKIKVVPVENFIEGLNQAFQAKTKGSDFFMNTLPGKISESLLEDGIRTPVIIDLNNAQSYITLN